MKPASFKYHAPDSVEEVLALLDEHGFDAKVLAGGQSLIPTMNFRLAQPAVLIDLNRVDSLSYIEPHNDGGLRIGAMTRQRELELDSRVSERAPLLQEALPQIAHPQIRNRGTLGGSLAHADPAAELPAITTALNARFRVRDRDKERWIPAQNFFIGMFSTVLDPRELLLEIHIPPLAPNSGWAFQEVARRHGDYALVGVAAVVTLDDRQRCQQAAIVFLSVGEGPVVAAQAAGVLIGQPLTEELIRHAADIAATKDIDPGNDIHASAAFRIYLANTLTIRALNRARQRAGGS